MRGSGASMRAHDYKTRTGVLHAGIFALPLLLAGGQQAHAAVVNGDLPVQIDIVSACEISAISGIDFGSHGVLSADIPGTGSFTVQCNVGETYTVGLGAGNGSGADTTTRKMTAPSSDTINYRLFQDGGHSLNWGNTIGTDTAGGTGNGDPQLYTVYGVVPAQTSPGTGTYNDTVQIIVDY